MSRTRTIWKWSSRVPEATRERLAACLVADVRLEGERIGGGAGHHHLDRALGIGVAMPLRAEPHELVVELDRDAAAHAHDHGLALERLRPALEVLDEISGDH